MEARGAHLQGLDLADELFHLALVEPGLPLRLRTQEGKNAYKATAKLLDRAGGLHGTHCTGRRLIR